MHRLRPSSGSAFLPAFLPAILVPLLAAATAPLSAQEKEPFTMERFQALQAEGTVILLDVFADWCPTCAIQQEVLSTFRAENPDVAFHTLVVDFDDQKEWVRHFGAPRQSTLILYRGQERLWFSVAETRAEVLEEQLHAAAHGG